MQTAAIASPTERVRILLLHQVHVFVTNSGDVSDGFTRSAADRFDGFPTPACRGRTAEIRDGAARQEPRPPEGVWVGGASDRGECCGTCGRNRDRGKPFGFSPPTSPCVRVRTRRFGRLSGRSGRKKGYEAEKLEELSGESFVKSRAFGQTPRTVAGAHRSRGEIT